MQPNELPLLNFLFTFRYQEAIKKYESVMKTEPDVQYYTNLAKERICFCLVKVRERLRTFGLYILQKIRLVGGLLLNTKSRFYLSFANALPSHFPSVLPIVDKVG